MDAYHEIETARSLALSVASELDKVLASFFANLHSPLTAREYKYTVTELFTFLRGEVHHPSELRRHHIACYRKHLETKGLGNKTILKKMSGVGSFCRYLAEVGLLDKDITYGVKRPKTQYLRETSDITDADVNRIFAALDEKKYNCEAYRAILAVGFFTELRSAEIRNLKIRNIGSVDGVKILNLKVKGDKAHEIPLHPFEIKSPSQHMQEMTAMGFDLDDLEHVLFPSLKTKINRPMTRETLCYIFKTCLENAKIEKSDFRRYSPHSMRATFASHLRNTLEAPLEDVQAALGHANPSTTQRYYKRRKMRDRSPIYRIDY